MDYTKCFKLPRVDTHEKWCFEDRSVPGVHEVLYLFDDMVNEEFETLWSEWLIKNTYYAFYALQNDPIEGVNISDQCDIYYGDLYKWLLNEPYADSFCNDVLSNVDIAPNSCIHEIIQRGQIKALQYIYDKVDQFLKRVL